MTIDSPIIAAYGVGTTNTANTTQYWCISGAPNPSGTETQQQITFRSAGTLKNFYLRVITNSCNNTTVYTSRKNAAAGGQTISVLTTQTGEFEDTSNSDAVVAGDKLNIRSVPNTGSTGTNTITIIGFLFAATTNTTTTLACTQGGTITPGALATIYNPVSGILQVNTTEANAKCRQRVPGTFQFLYVNISANSRTTTTVWNSRLNGANGALTVSVTSGQTGIFEDTTNSDTIVTGNDYCIAYTTGNSTETFVIREQAVTFVSTAGTSQLVLANAVPTPVPAAATRYNALGGEFWHNVGTELNTQMKTRGVFRFVELTCNVTANSATAPGTLNFRKNGTNGNMTISIPAGSTGMFSDSTNSDITTTTDEVNTQVNTGAGGTLTVNVVSVWVRTPTSQSNTLKYNVRQQIKSSDTYRYNIRKQILHADTLKYNLRKQIKSSDTYRWNIRKQIVRNNTLKYNLRKLIKNSRTLKYNLRKLVTHADTLKYNIRKQIKSSNTYRWNIRGRILHANTLKYNLRKTVLQHNTIRYNIRKTVIHSNTIKYNLRKLVTTQRTLKYIIRGRIVHANTLKYSIQGRVVRAFTIRYNIAQLGFSFVNHAITVKYNLRKRVTHAETLKYNVRRFVLSSRSLKYNLRKLIPSSRTVKYNIRKSVISSRILKYSLLYSVIKGRTLRYVIRQQVKHPQTLKYNLVGPAPLFVRVTRQITLIYEIFPTYWLMPRFDRVLETFIRNNYSNDINIINPPSSAISWGKVWDAMGTTTRTVLKCIQQPTKLTQLDPPQQVRLESTPVLIKITHRDQENSRAPLLQNMENYLISMIWANINSEQIKQQGVNHMLPVLYNYIDVDKGIFELDIIVNMFFFRHLP